ncbi:hypothetical protein [Methanolobus vulcani]|uniref:Membrane domain of glycerophosphoryl diester phosphodiesterase n=1 Tax=Methanolobus vulcani TaxID=38026 RepID=A0A7Z8P149_9EURY|nr:hypothetical protein [Methanolobus vulcani]TQD23559.1 hypothetical protein FKV42_13645 [Methanolobus vulcani]
MVEDIGTLVRKGFGTWTGNLNLCVPFILKIAASVFFLMFSVILFTILFIVPAMSDTIDPASMTQDEMFDLMYSVFYEHMLVIAIFSIFLFAIYMIIDSFIMAGAIGMAKEALEKGHTRIGTMFIIGKRNYLHLFFVNVLIVLLILAGVIFLVPGFLSIDDINILLSNPDMATASASLLVLGMFLWAFYTIIISLLLFLVNYVLVADELDPITAIETGVSFVLSNKLASIGMWLVIMGISFVLGVVGQITSYVDIVAQLWSLIDLLLSTIVIQPLITVWLTRFYLDRTERKLYSFEDYLLDY